VTGGGAAAAPARVTCWGELRGERPMPGVLRVLVAGQSAGGIERAGAEHGQRCGPGPAARSPTAGRTTMVPSTAASSASGAEHGQVHGPAVRPPTELPAARLLAGAAWPSRWPVGWSACPWSSRWPPACRWPVACQSVCL